MPDAIEQMVASVEKIEISMIAFQEKAEAEIKANGEASTETKNALDSLAVQQREIADRLLTIEQKGQAPGGGGTATVSMGQQFTNSDAYCNFQNGSQQRARFEVENNTISTDDGHVGADRRPGVVGGTFEPMTLESFLPSLPTTASAIEYVRESSFVNNAAEVAEGAQKPESDITFELQTMPVATVAHWIKISRQLAADAPALAAYINTRMIYGVNRRVETQLGVGDGAVPNISGLLNAGNFTAHTYAAADVGTTLPKLVLIRKLMGDLYVLGYAADAILLNPADWASIEIELLTSSGNTVRVSTDAMGTPMLFGIPVIQAIGVEAGKVVIGSFRQAATIYTRQGVTVDLSESDSDNFTKNLITVRAERRLALTVDRPGAILGGELAL